MPQRKEIKILLADSFKELVLEKPIEKITIKEITDRAGVIRVTFYNHFQDKYELLEWICREDIVEPIRLLLRNGMQEEAIAFMFKAILKDKGFYSHAAKLEGQNSFESIVVACFAEMITDFLIENAAHIKHQYEWLTPRRAGEFCAVAMTYVLINWIKSGMNETPSEMVEMYMFMTRHSMMDLVTEL